MLYLMCYKAFPSVDLQEANLRQDWVAVGTMQMIDTSIVVPYIYIYIYLCIYIYTFFWGVDIQY